MDSNYEVSLGVCWASLDVHSLKICFVLLQTYWDLETNYHPVSMFMSLLIRQGGSPLMLYLSRTRVRGRLHGVRNSLWWRKGKHIGQDQQEKRRQESHIPSSLHRTPHRALCCLLFCGGVRGCLAPGTLDWESAMQEFSSNISCPRRPRSL